MERERMNDIVWKDGGAKPLQRAEKCAICGETIFAGSRDYSYGYGEDSKPVRAHMLCVPKPPAEGQELLDVMYRIADAVETLVKRGSQQ